MGEVGGIPPPPPPTKYPEIDFQFTKFRNTSPPPPPPPLYQPLPDVRFSVNNTLMVENVAGRKNRGSHLGVPPLAGLHENTNALRDYR